MWYDYIGELFDLVNEAKLKLAEYFPDPMFTQLVLYRDPEGGDDHLSFQVLCAGEHYTESMEAFEKFRNDWWYERDSEASRYLSIGLHWN